MFEAPGSLLDAPESLLDAPESLLDASGSLLEAPGPLLDAPESLLEAPGSLLNASGGLWRSKRENGRLAKRLVQSPRLDQSDLLHRLQPRPGQPGPGGAGGLADEGEVGGDGRFPISCSPERIPK